MYFRGFSHFGASGDAVGWSKTEALHFQPQSLLRSSSESYWGMLATVIGVDFIESQGLELVVALKGKHKFAFLRNANGILNLVRRWVMLEGCAVFWDYLLQITQPWSCRVYNSVLSLLCYTLCWLAYSDSSSAQWKKHLIDWNYWVLFKILLRGTWLTGLWSKILS